MAKKYVDVEAFKAHLSDLRRQVNEIVPGINIISTVSVSALLDDYPAADVAPRWIPFTERELTAEEQAEHPEWCYIMECPLPDDGQEILVSDGKWVWQDAFHIDDGCYLDSDRELEGCAWMPLPEPYKEE